MSKKPTREEILQLKVPELKSHAHKNKINLEGVDKKTHIQNTILGHYGYELQADGQADAQANADETNATGETIAAGLNESGGEGAELNSGGAAADRDAGAEGEDGTVKAAAVPLTTTEAKPSSNEGDANEKLAADQIKATEQASGAKVVGTAPAQKVAGEDAQPETEEDGTMLLGSSVQPSEFDLGDGEKITLGQVVSEAFRRTKMSAADWNKLPDALREGQISEVVQDLETKGAGVVFSESQEPKSLEDALAGLLAFEHSVRGKFHNSGDGNSVASWNLAVKHAKLAIAQTTKPKK